MSNFKITIIGGGLAGSEAALVLSRRKDFYIKLVEMRPIVSTEVHKTEKFAELVCSNSFKSMKADSAAGMLKNELKLLDSPLYLSALNNAVDAGNALAVNREDFANEITNKILQTKNIVVCREEFWNIEDELNNCDALILATGPLTSAKLSEQIKKITGSDNLAFYDAAAPIVMDDSIDKNIVFTKDRYDKNNSGDYLNAPLNKQEYENFIENLLAAECVIKKDFETKELFQACQPIEEIAKTGFDAPRYGAMKPVGLEDPRTGKRPYAVVQLRCENKQKTAWNIVGFQTNLTFPEQKRVFSMIPGLNNADFARFGVMHRNTFIDSPKLLNKNLELKDNLYIAGQLSGTEGYLEAVRSGHHVAISLTAKLLRKKIPYPSNDTVFGALLDYATNKETKKYQPMHVNFGIIEPLEQQVRNKKQRYMKYCERANKSFEDYVKQIDCLWTSK